MKKSTIIIGLVLIIIALFIFNPNWLGRGEKTPQLLSIVPADNTMAINTNISCTKTQDCITYALSQDPTATNITATCDKTCTYITTKTPLLIEE